MLVRPAQERYQSNVYEQTVFFADFKRNLSDRFNKRLAFDIADCAAYFGYYNIRIGLFGNRVYE